MDFESERLKVNGLTPEDLVANLPPGEPCMLWSNSPKFQLPSGEISHFPANNTTVVLKPKSIVCLHKGVLSIEKPGLQTLEMTLGSEENPFSIIREHFDFLKYPVKTNTTDFIGGLMGFVSYDSGRYFETIRGASGHKKEPDIFLMESPLSVCFDREKDEIVLRWLPDYCAAEDLAEIKALFAPPRASKTPHPILGEPRFQELHSREQFTDMVKRAKEYICAGDIFQVVLANSFTAPEPTNPLSAFAHLRISNPSPYHFLVRFGAQTLVGASPEVMLRGRREDDKLSVSMRLVAGTYPKNNSADIPQAQMLGSDAKEVAEHLMLVDHARNDIGRVSEIGKVKVSDMFSVETYADVHHLVSQVSGIISTENDALAALQSCFPIATLTGTPKIRAMEIIAELEGPSRGIFGGAVVQLGYDGSIDSAVAIRALVTDNQSTKIQAGAGIVYDSNPEREYEECHWKARALFEAARLR